MRDIWNPWHGCVKCSEGCENCYMYYLDRMRDKNGAEIYQTSNSRYPLSKDRKGRFKIQSGETISVCMTSDFFLEDADPWRDEAWDVMRMRRDVVFYLLTKRPQRVADCLPADWGDGWENVFFNVTCENQRRADERMPILLELPFKHKGVSCTPLIGPVRLTKYLDSGHRDGVYKGRPAVRDQGKTASDKSGAQGGHELRRKADAVQSRRQPGDAHPQRKAVCAALRRVLCRVFDENCLQRMQRMREM